MIHKVEHGGAIGVSMIYNETGTVKEKIAHKSIKQNKQNK
jgi:hypothetical protein